MSYTECLASEQCTSCHGWFVNLPASGVCQPCTALAHNLRISVTTTRDPRTGRYASRKAS